MPITGRVDFGAGGGPNESPNGVWALIGEDGNHYILDQVGLGGFISIGCAETNTVTDSISATDFLNDVVTINPLITAPATSDVLTNLPVRGTKYVGGLYGDADGNVAGVFYKIDSSGQLVMEGGFAFSALSADFGYFSGGNTGVTGAASLINGELYIATCCDALALVLAHVPYLGTTVDLSEGSWDARCTQLPFGNVVGQLLSGGRNYTAFNSIYDAGDGDIGVFLYFGASENGGVAKLLHTIVDPDAHLTTGSADVSELFGIPFDDTLKLYDGSPTSDIQNDYYAPFISGSEVTFSRIFTDNIDTVLLRRFSMTDIDNILSLGTLEVTGFTISSVSTALETCNVHRDGDTLLLALRDRRFVYFHETTVEEPDPDAPSECGAEDEADELAAAITWPKCELVPGNINVCVVSQTVSPGRSFSGIEQLIHPDSGFWRITYRDVRIRTKAHALKWREIESGCNGRNNPILVPLYEAKLSDIPIVATPADAYPIGATRINILQTAGEDIRAGMHFSAGEWGYRVKRVIDPETSVITISIWPPLRQAIGTETELDFNDPHVRCRLERDDGMDVNLELLRFASPDVTFVEDV